MTVLALDIGGTKLVAAVVAPDGRVLRSARRATPPTDVLDACIGVLTLPSPAPGG